MVDLSTYVRVGRYDLPEPTRTNAPENSVLAQEVSAVTYNKDTDTLFVVGDGGTSIVQISKTGELIDSMTLAPGTSPQNTEFYDTEGLTYIGNGQFVMTEERDRNVVLFTYEAGTTLTRADAKTVDMGTFVPNTGFEGLSYDPLTGGFIIVKETDPISVFQSTVDFDARTASNGSPTTENAVDLFDPDNLHVADLADVFALSNLDTSDDHLLLLSQESARILEVDRDGNVLSTMNIVSDPGNPLAVESQQHEGITMDDDGYIYVVSENGGGDIDHPQLWVYAPATEPNEAPTDISLVDALDALEENVSTTARIKIASIAIADDGQGINNYSLSGDDAGFFEVDNTGVYLKAGTDVDYETKTSYSFTVEVDDPNLGGTPDASTSYTLNVIDAPEEGGGSSSLFISEVAAWSSGSSPVGADWFEVTNGGTGAIDLTGWKVDDSSSAFASAVALSGVTSIAAGESVIFIETDDPATIESFVDTWFGGTAPDGLQIGTYSGGGIGLSTGGDAVNLYDGEGALQANVTFGASPAGPAFQTFHNAARSTGGEISALSEAGQNGAFVASDDAHEIGSPGSFGRIFISEVAPWSSSTSSVGADWFEVTNSTASAIDIDGWKVDDNSESPVGAVALNGVTSIAPGESVIFLNGSGPEVVTAFIDTWFGGTAPDGLQIGTYAGDGVGLSDGGDAVNLYDDANVLRASVSFGESPQSPLATFDNGAALNGTQLSTLSSVGTNGAFAAAADANQIGSPGDIVSNDDDALAFTSPTEFDAAENQRTAASLTAIDPEDDTISFSIVGGADDDLFEIDAQTGAVSFLTAPDFEIPGDADQDNSYELDVQASDGVNTAIQTITVNVTDVDEDVADTQVVISEVAPWSSGDSPVAADWFEVTNRGSTALDITGWKVDDSSASFASAVALTGITSIAAGESVIFLESSDPEQTIAAFIDTWFGGTTPEGLQIGTYSGGGIGLSGSGDAVNLYNGSGELQANVTFGASPEGPVFQTFNNAAGTDGGPISTLSAVDENGAFEAINDANEIGSPGSVGRIFVSEVAAWSSGTSVGADWFEVTNTTASTIDISGWKVDDSSNSSASAVALNGITSIAAGESVIFLESSNPEETIAAFIDTWFGGTAPDGLQIGTYSGSGIGLSGSGDALNLYDANNVLQANVSFGASPSSPLATFDNGAALDGTMISALSSVGTNGAFAAAADAGQIGSPGEVTSNDAPLATDDDRAVDEDAVVTGDLLANDSDPQARDILTVASVGDQAIDGETIVKGEYGTLTIDEDGNYSYAADGDRTDALANGQQRTDSFNYTVSDGHGGIAGATLAVLVSAIDDSVATNFLPDQIEYEGNAADEFVTGNDEDNSIFGMGGADIIDAGEGADTIAGGAGDDSLVGGLGNDYLYGGGMGDGDSEGGNDTLIGGEGSDHIYGNSLTGAGNDTDGADVIDTGDGVNYANGQGGDDVITGGDGRDRIQGGRDEDELSGGAGNDQINGNMGDDTISGGDGNDILRGGKDDDVLIGDGGNDVLMGDLGNDTLVAGAGVDVMTGGMGADRFDLSGAGAGNFDLADFYTAIVDFEQGVDRIELGFAVATGEVLQAGSFGSVAAAQTAAQLLLTGHAGTQDVAAAQVGDTTYLFYNASGSADPITGIVAMFDTAAASIDQFDFA